MTSGDWITAYLGTAALAIFLLFILVARIAHKDGFNDGRDYERNRQNQRALEAARRPPTRLIEQPWPHHGYGRHSVWAQRMTVRTDTVSFAGGPATVPISHRTDSGELRALAAGTDQYIERMRREENAWRGQMVTR